MSDVMRQARALEAMVNQERAHALSLTGERLERELAELRRLEASLAGLAGRELARTQKLFDDCRLQAGKQLWQLMVQREALGLSRHDDVYETYRVPRWVVPRPF